MFMKMYLLSNLKPKYLVFHHRILKLFQPYNSLLFFKTDVCAYHLSSGVIIRQHGS